MHFIFIFPTELSRHSTDKLNEEEILSHTARDTQFVNILALLAHRVVSEGGMATPTISLSS